MSKKVRKVECVKGQRISRAERTEGKHTAKKYSSGKVLETRPRAGRTLLSHKTERTRQS